MVAARAAAVPWMIRLACAGAALTINAALTVVTVRAAPATPTYDMYLANTIIKLNLFTPLVFVKKKGNG